MGKWNFDDIENSLVNDAEKRITRGYQQPSAEDVRGQVPDVRGQVPGNNNLAGAPARGQSLGSVPMPTDSPQAAEQIIGLKGPDTKGVQTYLPLKDYMRLMQQKTLRKQNIAQIAGEAIIDWLDRQEQSPSASGQK
jgi:hypothetical protein